MLRSKSNQADIPQSTKLRLNVAEEIIVGCDFISITTAKTMTAASHLGVSTLEELTERNLKRRNQNILVPLAESDHHT